MNTAADVAFVRIFNFVDDTAADTIMKRLTIQILLSLKWKKLGCIAIQYIYVYHAHLWILLSLKWKKHGCIAIHMYMYIMPTYGFFILLLRQLNYQPKVDFLFYSNQLQRQKLV